MNLKNKNILVLGGAGFIGSSLVRGLMKEGANVIVYDNFSFGHIKNLQEIGQNIKVINADILDYEKLSSVIQQHNVKIMFHLVANPFIPNSYKYPEEIFNLITKGTQNVLKACEQLEVEKLLYVSSAEIYGNYKYLPIDENHPCKPLSVYASAKLAADKKCSEAYKQKKIPVTILRLFNTFGPRETHPYIIPDLISQLSVSNIARIGNTKSKRSFVYVEDVIDAFMKIMKKNLNGEIINVGNNYSYSIEQLAKIIGNLFGHDKIKIVIESKRKRKLDPKNLECDYSKAKDIIDWKPKTSFEEGLRKTLDWFEENGRNWVWKETYGKI